MNKKSIISICAILVVILIGSVAFYGYKKEKMEERIEAQYSSFMQQGEQAMNSNDYTTAMSAFTSAKSVKNTQEADSDFQTANNAFVAQEGLGLVNLDLESKDYSQALTDLQKVKNCTSTEKQEYTKDLNTAQNALLNADLNKIDTCINNDNTINAYPILTAMAKINSQSQQYTQGVNMVKSAEYNSQSDQALKLAQTIVNKL